MSSRLKTEIPHLKDKSEFCDALFYKMPEINFEHRIFIGNCFCQKDSFLTLNRLLCKIY